MMRASRTMKRASHGGQATRNWRRIVADASLAPEAQAVVTRVLRRSRLWPWESLAVAEELVGHFLNAAASGISAVQAVADFGDPILAARLIRQAMHRRRSRRWHVLRWIRRSLVGVLLLYAMLSAYFYSGRPNPAIDYIAVLNHATLQTPIDQRAWPLYRQAIVAMGRPEWPDFLTANPDGPAWPTLAEFVAAHPDAIETVRLGAARPALGFVLGPHGSIEDPAVFRRFPRSEKTPLDSEDWRFVQDLRRLGIILSLDAKAARLANDGPRLIRDITALLDMAEQLRPPTATLMESLAGVNVDYWAIQQTDATLVQSPALLTDAQLVQLADRIGRWQTASDLLRLTGDRLLFEDLVQHVYTDDGAGNGRITAEGLLQVRLSFDDPGFAEFLAAPLSLLQVASRKDVLQKYDEFISLKELELHRPARDLIGEADRRKLRIDSHPDQLSTQYGVITAFFANPYIGGSEILLGERDGVLVGIALERFRRLHGHYPVTLDQLVPTFLSAIPPDRITGNPVKYLLHAGKPLIYSVGADRVDNGGRPGLGMYGPDPTITALWPPMRMVIPGDWILYPHAQ
jgi:hypothetical protein